FFQAEDGIRDRNVTGVQTCALPICIAGPQPPEASSWAAPEPAPPQPAPVSPARAESTTQVTRPPSGGQSDAMHVMATLLVSQLRSEERRVGKECRSRWSAAA